MSAEQEAKLLEAAAALEHERWSRWMRHLFSVGEMLPDGTWVMPAWAVDRWKRQAETPYDGLSEPEKESDRREVREQLALVERFRKCKRCGGLGLVRIPCPAGKPDCWLHYDDCPDCNGRPRA